MGTMSTSDAAPLPRLGEVFFDVRSTSRSLRISWYADTGVAVLSIWQAGTCTGSFRLPMADLPRMIHTLQRGPDGLGAPGGVLAAPGGRPAEYLDHPTTAYPASAAGVRHDEPLDPHYPVPGRMPGHPDQPGRAPHPAWPGAASRHDEPPAQARHAARPGQPPGAAGYPASTGRPHSPPESPAGRYQNDSRAGGYSPPAPGVEGQPAASPSYSPGRPGWPGEQRDAGWDIGNARAGDEGLELPPGSFPCSLPLAEHELR